MPARLTPVQVRLAVAGLFIFFLLGMAVTINGPLGVALAPRFPGAEASQISSAFFVGSAVVILASVLTKGRISTIWLVRCCTSSYVLGGALVCFAPSWPLVLAGILLAGCANGGMGMWFNAEMARTMPAYWLAILNGHWALGAILGPQLLNLLVKTPQMPHGVLAALGLLALPLAWRVQQTFADDHDPTHASVPAKAYMVAGLMALYVFTETLLFAFATQQVMATHRFPLQTATIVLSAMMIGFTVGRFAFGLVPATVRQGTSLMVLGAIAAAGAALSGVPGMVWVGYVLLGLGIGPVFPVIIAWGATVVKNAHQVTGIVTAGAVVAAAISPSVGNAAFRNQPGAVALTTAALFALLSLAAFGVDRVKS